MKHPKSFISISAVAKATFSQLCTNLHWQFHWLWLLIKSVRDCVFFALKPLTRFCCSWSKVIEMSLAWLSLTFFTHVCECICMCVYVWNRERERERERDVYGNLTSILHSSFIVSHKALSPSSLSVFSFFFCSRILQLLFYYKSIF